MKSFAETNKAKKVKGGQEAVAKKEAGQKAGWKGSSGDDEGEDNEEAFKSVLNAREALKNKFARKSTIKPTSKPLIEQPTPVSEGKEMR